MPLKKRVRRQVVASITNYLAVTPVAASDLEMVEILMN